MIDSDQLHRDFSNFYFWKFVFGHVIILYYDFKLAFGYVI